MLSRPQPKGDVRARTERDSHPLAITGEFGVRTALTQDVGILTGARVGVDELSPSGLGIAVEAARDSEITIHESTLFIAGNYHWGTDRGVRGRHLAGVDLALTHSLALGVHAELNGVVAKIDGQASLLPVLSGWFGARLSL